MGIKNIIRLPVKNQCDFKESQEGVLSNILKNSKNAQEREVSHEPFIL